MKAIKVRYVGPTNYKPSRLIVSDSDKARKIYSYSGCEDDGQSSTPRKEPERIAAERFVADRGWLSGGRLIGGRLGNGVTVFCFEHSWI
jgi:hypothetical protein